MEYVSTTKMIKKHFANAKFWFASWNKERCAEMRAKIVATIALLKELLASLLSATACNMERDEASVVQQEIIQMEQLIA